MARLVVRLPRILAPFCEGQTLLDVSGATVGEALDDAFAHHSLLRTHLFDDGGAVREHLHLFLNETDVRNDLAAATRDGDEITVLQAMSGGCPAQPSGSARCRR